MKQIHISERNKRQLLAVVSKLVITNVDELRLNSDHEYIDIDSPTIMQRLLPDNRRPSVIVNQAFMNDGGLPICVYPQNWLGGHRKRFGCIYCTEQDCCPVFLFRYNRTSLRIRHRKHEEFDSKNIELAKKFWNV